MQTNSKVHLFLLILLFFMIALACRLPGSRRGNDVLPTESATGAGETSTSEATAVSVETAVVLDRYQIDQDKHPQALCNDGTTPLFYFRRGVGDGANKWIIWFKGGGAGWSKETMQGRHISLISNKQWLSSEYITLGSGGNQGSPDGEAGGIMSSIPEENPDFYNWNVAYLVYCSSDGWTGTRAASPETGNIHFAGHYIATAMLDALMSADIVGSPNLSDASHVILSGSSAGAQGLRSNVDRLAEMLSFADVRAISDAGVFFFGIPEFETIFDETTQAQFQMWQSVLDEDCTADNPDNPWVCLNGGVLVDQDYIQTPMFIHQDQEDVKLREALQVTGFDLNTHLPSIGAATRPLLERQDGVYSPIQGRHIILNTNRFSKFRFEGHTMAEIFGNWYFDREGTKVLIQYP